MGNVFVNANSSDKSREIDENLELLLDPKRAAEVYRAHLKEGNSVCSIV